MDNLLSLYHPCRYELLPKIYPRALNSASEQRVEFQKFLIVFVPHLFLYYLSLI